MTAKIGDIWYRIDDPWQDGSPPSASEYTVVRVTPKGVRLQFGVYTAEQVDERVKYDAGWITRYSKFVLLPDVCAGPRARFGGAIDAGRRHAYPTLEMARGSYLIRKQWQLRRSLATVDRVQNILEREKLGELWDERAPTGKFQFTV